MQEKKMILAGTKIHLVACKDADYQKRVLDMYKALSSFLTSNKLSKTNLVDRYNENPEEFKIMSEDLTEFGFDWAKKYLDKSMRSMDRRKVKTYETYLNTLNKTIKNNT